MIRNEEDDNQREKRKTDDRSKEGEGEGGGRELSSHDALCNASEVQREEQRDEEAARGRRSGTTKLITSLD